MLSCYFKEYLGIECPGCGMQRAFFYLLDGDIKESFIANPACIPLMVTAMILILQLIFKWEKGGKWVMYNFASSAAIMLINYVYKIITGQIF